METALAEALILNIWLFLCT